MAAAAHPQQQQQVAFLASAVNSEKHLQLLQPIAPPPIPSAVVLGAPAAGTFWPLGLPLPHEVDTLGWSSDESCDDELFTEVMKGMSTAADGGDNGGGERPACGVGRHEIN